MSEFEGAIEGAVAMESKPASTPEVGTPDASTVENVQPKTDENGVETPWYSDINGDYHDRLSKFKSQDDFIQSHIELEKKFSSTRPNAPKSADEYTYKPGEGFELDDKAFGDFKANAHQLGLSDDQLTAVMKAYEGYGEQQAQLQAVREQDEFEATENQLKKEWGDNYDNRISEIQKTIEKFGMADDLVELGLKANYKVLKMFDNLTDRMGEDTSPDNPGKGMTWDERANALRDKIDALPMGNEDRKRYEKQLISMYERRFPGGDNDF